MTVNLPRPLHNTQPIDFLYIAPRPPAWGDGLDSVDNWYYWSADNEDKDGLLPHQRPGYDGPPPPPHGLAVAQIWRHGLDHFPAPESFEWEIDKVYEMIVASGDEGIDHRDVKKLGITNFRKLIRQLRSAGRVTSSGSTSSRRYYATEVHAQLLTQQ